LRASKRYCVYPRMASKRYSVYRGEGREKNGHGKRLNETKKNIEIWHNCCIKTVKYY
ncbi:MAG: hypothetical protein FD167_4974, partial [bacterium]